MKSNKIPHLTWREYIAAVSALKRAIDNATRSGHKMTAKALNAALIKISKVYAASVGERATLPNFKSRLR